MEHWYLLVRTRDGTVKTAYPRLDITDEDKQILMRDDRYRQINNDEFRIWRHLAEPITPFMNVALPTEAELPDDLSQSAEELLEQLCD